MRVSYEKAREIVEYYKQKVVGGLMNPEDPSSRKITDLVIIPSKVDTSKFTKSYINTKNNNLAIAASNLGGDEFNVKILHSKSSDIYFMHGELENYLEKSGIQKIF